MLCLGPLFNSASDVANLQEALAPGKATAGKGYRALEALRG
ncbi:hypothetical protein PMIT1327_00360 [Prochlorococcus marinus str. MIT 1327]|nr:hypothetical protein PMIT1327_00360 [Prochlorococcus marinus str. MIT 1327]